MNKKSLFIYFTVQYKKNHLHFDTTEVFRVNLPNNILAPLRKVLICPCIIWIFASDFNIQNNKKRYQIERYFGTFDRNKG